MPTEARARNHAGFCFLGQKMKKNSISMLKPRVAALCNGASVFGVSVAEGTKRTRGRAWMKKRDEWIAQHPSCVDCGRIHPSNQVDHVVPLWEGGADDSSNYATRCVDCHAKKTAGEAARRAGGG